MIELSNNFTLAEFEHSDTAFEKGIDNTIPELEQLYLKILCDNVMQPLREWFGKSIYITSGYRSPILNYEIKGSKTSQHVKGQACDFKCSDLAKCFNYIKNNLEYDQLIWEYGNSVQPDWIHVSFNPHGNRNQVLTIK